MILYIYISKLKIVKFPPAHVVTMTTLEPLYRENDLSIPYDVIMNKRHHSIIQSNQL